MQTAASNKVPLLHRCGSHQHLRTPAILHRDPARRQRAVPCRSGRHPSRRRNQKQGPCRNVEPPRDQRRRTRHQASRVPDHDPQGSNPRRPRAPSPNQPHPGNPLDRRETPYHRLPRLQQHHLQPLHHPARLELRRRHQCHLHHPRLQVRHAGRVF